ncbi:hypothetical protein ACLM5J_07670 [Nocardioides sp. Bht2]|uniref:hypothetical protein n=1 Tax=Nocardioides sp. Bht2 TaxID=3392297 RepID=UPI0039B6E91D
MDLLIAARRAGVVVAVLLALGGCGEVSTTSSADRPALEPVTPTPLRPDESPIGEASGTGTSPAAITGRSLDLVIVYGTCVSETEAELALRTTLPRSEPLPVPCDGIVTRTQIFTVPGKQFQIDVDAPAGVRWNLVVTGRDEAAEAPD